jgi:hypothetical protein
MVGDYNAGIQMKALQKECSLVLSASNTCSD